MFPFKDGAADESLTANAGLVLFEKLICYLWLEHWLRQEMSRPGSEHGYQAMDYVMPPMLVLNGGGRSLDDAHILKNDFALSNLLRGDVLPSTDAVSNWLRHTWTVERLTDLSRINQRIIATRIWQASITPHTQKVDASRTIAEKKALSFYLQGRTGCISMI